MKQVVIVLFLVCLLTACSHKTTAPGVSRFPGFTRVANEGPGSKFYVETASMKRKDGVVLFKLLQLLSDGYAIQQAAIGPAGQFASESGMKYKEDGTEAGEFSGIPLSQNLESQPGLKAVVSFVRDEFGRKTAIAEPFEDSKALELLYGTYRTDLNGVQRENLVIPSELENTGLPSEGVARVFLSKEFLVDGRKKHIILVATNSEGNDCHACRPYISAAIFELSDRKWQLSLEYPFIDVPGAYGEQADCSWKQVGASEFGLVMKFTGGGQGYLSTDYEIALLNSGKIEEILTHTIDYSMEDPFDCDLRLDPSKKEFWDVTITVSNCKKRNKVSESHYQFLSGKYILSSGKPSSEIEDNISAFGVNGQSSEYSQSDDPVRAKSESSSSDDVPTKTLFSSIQVIESILKSEGASDFVGVEAGLRNLVTQVPVSRVSTPDAISANERGLAELRSGNFEEAVVLFKEAIALNPVNSKYFNNLGLAELKAGRIESARLEFQKAISVEPYKTIAWGNLAVALAKQGNSELALSSLLVAARTSKEKTLKFINDLDYDDVLVENVAKDALARIVP